MARQRTLLFLTNSELGQASVMLAVAAEVALESSFAVHVGSFSPLAKSVPDSVKFHCIPGPSMKEVLIERGIGFLPMHPPGLRGAATAYQEALPAVVAPWEPKRYFDIYDYCCELIKDLDPSLVVLDPLLGAGFDACTTLKRRCVILSPNTAKDHATAEQPGLLPIWRYPMYVNQEICRNVTESRGGAYRETSVAAGYPVPLPYWAIPLNFYLCVRMLVQSHAAAPVKELIRARNQRGIPGGLSTTFTEWYGNIPYLVPSTPDTDFPLRYTPPNLRSCGPIIPRYEEHSKTDPELALWLGARPTIVINMGSHVTHAAVQAAEIFRAVQICLDKHSDIQILWKLQSESIPDIPQSLAPRVRIMSWFPSSPAAILTAARSVVAYVHHGGSNSFHEAVAVGVPQVVCPVWLDTYDFATRVEHLGIGVRGNLIAAPDVDGEELSSSFDKVLEVAGAEAMRRKARELSILVGGVDTGRKNAARWTLDAAKEPIKE